MQRKTGKSRKYFFIAALSMCLITPVVSADEIKKLPIEKIKIKNIELHVEVARSPEEQQKGLMFRKTLCPNCGMLFVYPSERIMSFWMKNTFIPLSIGFFDKNKVLVDVQDMEPVKSEMQVDIPTYQSRVPAMYALELNKGWFKANKVALRTKFVW